MVYSDDTHQLHPILAAAAHDRGRLTEHDIRYPSSRPNGRVEEEEGEGEVGRPMKRRKIGLAESLISTAISVVIVSTAVGYTAYRMWRDGAFSSTPKAIEARGGRVEEVKDEENEEGAGEDGMASKYATIRSTATTTTVSPPPPYREDAMIDLEEDVDAWMRMNRTPTRMGDGAYVYSERGSRSGLPMLSSLAPSSSPVSPRRIGGGGGSVHHLSSSAQNGHRKRASGRGRHSHSYARHGNKVSTTNGGIGAGGGGSGMTSPVRRYLREEAIGKSSSSSGSYPTVATKKKVEARGEDDEEEEEEMLFDAQMAWMSERVKGLIADGQRALGRPIVLATEGASSASARAGAGAGGLSEGEEGGWLTER
ncbi:hypothetical protein FRC17_008817 [Serendipita sp. 399]|nr:hypothetical protein FRC17_008817 [Serendipita sp. 399]